MKNIAVLPLLFAAAFASAQSPDRWYLPNPDELVKASNSLCMDQTKSALLAWNYRKQGMQKEDVLALIPESPKAFSLRLVSAMRENVEDVYSYPEISQYTYYSFRAEVCFRETLGGVRMPRLSSAYAAVAECQRTQGEEKSSQLFKCVQAVVRSMEPRL